MSLSVAYGLGVSEIDELLAKVIARNAELVSELPEIIDRVNESATLTETFESDLAIDDSLNKIRSAENEAIEILSEPTHS